MRSMKAVIASILYLSIVSCSNFRVFTKHGEIPHPVKEKICIIINNEGECVKKPIPSESQ